MVQILSAPQSSARRAFSCCALAALLLSSCEKSVIDEQVRRPSPSTGSNGNAPNNVNNGGGGASGNDLQPDAGVVFADGSVLPGATSGRGGQTSAAGGTPSVGSPGAGSGGQAPITGFGGAGGAGGSDTGGPVEPPPFSKRGLLTALGDCARWSYQEFAELAQQLTSSTTTLATDDTSAHQQAATSAWSQAMASWQRAEPFRFGPAARSMNPGGQDLRDQIYVFPLTNYCKIDQTLVDQSYQNAPGLVISARGLSSIEYLLFNASSNNACVAQANINSSGSWAALSSAQLRERRLLYAREVAGDVLSRATSLNNAWDPSKGNFYQQLVEAGGDSTVFASSQDAFNAVTDGLFYIEKEVKDWKLGWPLGLVPECLNAPNPCPNEVESRHAHASTDHLRQNLIGFRRAFQGCGINFQGLGFDDWLVEAGAEDLAERMLDALLGAQTAVDGLNPPLEQSLLTAPQNVLAVHAAVKALTDLLKTEFVTVLNLDLPMASEGDND